MCRFQFSLLWESFNHWKTEVNLRYTWWPSLSVVEKANIIKSSELMLPLFIVRIVRNTSATGRQDAELLLLKLAVCTVTTGLQNDEG